MPALRLKADKAIGHLAAIVDSSQDAIVSKTLDGIITTWNAGAERLFGYTANEAVGQHISLIIPQNRRNEETAILQKIARGERIEHFDTVRIHKDGTTLDISLTVSPVRDTTGKVVGASKIARDITQRKRMERSLQESEERYRTLADALDTQVRFRTQELQRRNEEIVRQADQLRDLAGRMLQAQDEERRRFARDLHDSAGQTLAVMSMKLAQMAEDAKSAPAQLSNMVQEVEELVQGLTQEIRTTSYLLYPPMLDESGLSYALRWYVEGLVDRSGLEVDLKIPDSFERLSREMELVIFRVVQECLTNIHRHSGSKTALIRIERQHENVHVTVQDSGKGMSPEKLAEIQSQGKGVGLRGMRERVRNFQGEFTVESSGSGTKVSAILPAKKPALTHHSETPELGVA
jgi:two-component system sensor histidine kinase UhpB